jgi:formylglycine-generating enzyme required for sulfatase activity
MNRKILYFLSFLLISGCTVQNKIFKPSDKKSPPGTIWLRDNLYFDITEISNISYREMIYWYKKKYGLNSEIVSYILPVASPVNVTKTDTVLNTITYSFPYLNLPEYHDYPVVGITYNQALLFCNWRSDRVNELYFVTENKIKVDSANLYLLDSLYDIPKKVKYRLPTIEEWEYASFGGLDTTIYKFGYKDFIDNNGFTKSLTFDYVEKKMEIENDTIIDDFPKTESVYYGKPNEFGCYNLVGNVSEIVQEEGIYKGINWKENIDEFKISDDFFYSEPSFWLGFRCICELYE